MKIRAVILFSLIFGMFVPVKAQGEAPTVIKSTKPISAELRGYLDAWLAVDPPSNAPYYIVTNMRQKDGNMMVSLVGVNLSSPDEEWSFAHDDKTVWMGSVIVTPEGEVTQYSQDPTQASVGVLAMPSLAPGGGSYVAFPFAAGFAMQYGPRGVHAAGYSTSGMQAVDLVGGDDMGVSAAPPYVYASDAGTVDYVCDDGTTVAIRTYNSTTGDYFIYAHMLDNANLVESHTFQQGELIGSLKYGSFNPESPNCGWASQAASHYHVHWAFVPANGYYQVGSCILNISTQAWDCGGQIVQTGGFLTGGGGYSTPGNSSGESGAGAVVTDPTFFDYLLTGIITIADVMILRYLPTHEPFAYTFTIIYMAEIVLRVAWLFVAGNINLYFVVLALSVTTVGVKLASFTIWAIAAVVRLIKSIPLVP